MMYRKTAVVVCAGIVGLGLGACSIQRAQEAAKAKATMVGMTKEQVLSCMGSPANAAKAGGVEVWTFNSGNGQTDTFGTASAWGSPWYASAFGTSTSTSRYCKVDIVMNRGRVSRVNYSGPTGGLLTEGEQCAYAVDNCARDATLLQSASADNPAAAEPDPSVGPEPGIAPAVVSRPVQNDAQVKKMARELGYGYQSKPSQTDADSGE